MATADPIEERSYDLNRCKAMKKKLSATNECLLTVTDTGGGVKLSFNTGMYELFRFASDDFYSSDTMRPQCKKITVTDKKGNVVETKYKVRVNKGHYTLNLYHTTCSSLVNGKCMMKFVQEDVLEIFSLIENRLSDNNCTIDQFNEHIKSMILNYNQQRSECSEVVHETLEFSNTSTVINYSDTAVYNVETIAAQEIVITEVSDSIQPPLVELPDTSVSSVDTNDTNMIEDVSINEQRNQVSTNYINSETIKQTVTTADLYNLVVNIDSAVKDIRQTVDQHVIETNQQLCQIRDEIVSMKKQCSLQGQSSVKRVEELNIHTDKLHGEVTKLSSTLQKRVQGLYDIMRSMQVTASACNDKKKSCESNSPEPEVHPTSTPERLTNNSRVSNTPRTSPRRSHTQRTKTLIIGDSILKEIDRRGVNPNVEVISLSGATVDRVAQTLSRMDVTQFQHVVLYIGGNNVSSGQHILDVYKELKLLVSTLQKSQCTVYVCTLSPRSDVDVIPWNDAIKQLCEELSTECINCYESFIYGNGDAVRNFYHRDNVHLSRQGTSNLLHTINRYSTIMTRRNGRVTPGHTNESNPRSYTLRQPPRYNTNGRGNRHNTYPQSHRQSYYQYRQFNQIHRQ